MAHKGPAAAVDRHVGRAVSSLAHFSHGHSYPTLGSRCNWNQALEWRCSGCFVGRGFWDDASSGACISATEVLTLKWLLSHTK